MAEEELNTKGLDKIIKTLREQRIPNVVVGILGSKGGVRKEGDGITNASVGAMHEFGTSQLPVRSFLRVPITNLLDKKLKAAGAFDKSVIERCLQTGEFTEWLKKIGVVAEEIVQGAFDSGGYGEWPPSNMSNKTNHQTLVETTQLRESITSEVRNKVA